MAERYIILEKRIGYTPLAELEELKKKQVALSTVPLTYAGRLDPMASGKLLVLVGDECKKRESYDQLEKEYVFDVVCGVTTDTGDCLGMPRVGAHIERITKVVADEVCTSLVGVHVVPYPAFSSKPVNGKPLFMYALEGTIDAIERPRTRMQIFSLACASVKEISIQDVAFEAKQKISLLQIEKNTGTVARDFRRVDISAVWDALEKEMGVCTVLSCKAVVNSGTYIRTLAECMGERLHTVSFASSIHRSKIGRYIQLPLVGGVWAYSY
jgi:tRNA pseudouridine(55) synthase